MSRKVQRVCIVGAGAIGGWIAAKLALAGHDVRVVARGDTLAILQRDGVTLVEGDSERTIAIPAAADAAELGEQDLVVLAVKAPALPSVAPTLRPLVRRDTLIVPMLNGVPWWFVEGEPLQAVDPDGSVAASIPAAQLVGCVVHASCSRAAPNAVVVKHADKLILGEPDGGRSERVEWLCRLFDDAGIRCEHSEDVRRAIWYKLWGNATINPLSALTRATADRILGDPDCRAWMLEAMAELAAVGAAIGCPISEGGEDRMQVTARLGAFKTSMLQDVEAGRPLELQALLGAPREIAKARAIATPSLDRLYAATRLMAESLGLR